MAAADATCVVFFLWNVKAGLRLIWALMERVEVADVVEWVVEGRAASLMAGLCGGEDV